MFHDEDVTFTSAELTVLSDIIRRVRNARGEGLFSASPLYRIFLPEFTSAAEKIENAKYASFATAGEE